MPHTKTPWKVFTSKSGNTYIGIGEESGDGIVDAGFGLWRDSDEAKPNAEFIVKAVNAHDDLVSLLQEAHEHLFVGLETGPMESEASIYEREFCTRISAALAKAVQS